MKCLLYDKLNWSVSLLLNQKQVKLRNPCLGSMVHYDTVRVMPTTPFFLYLFQDLLS